MARLLGTRVLAGVLASLVAAPAPAAATPDPPEVLVSFTADPGTSLYGAYPPAQHGRFAAAVAAATVDRLRRNFPFLRWVTSGTTAAYRMQIRLRPERTRSAVVAVEKFHITVDPATAAADPCARFAIRRPRPVEFTYVPSGRLQDRVATVADLIVNHISMESLQSELLGPIRVPYRARLTPEQKTAVIETTLDALQTDAGHLAFNVDLWTRYRGESCIDTRIPLEPRGRADHRYILAVFDTFYYGNRAFRAEPPDINRLVDHQLRGVSVARYVRVDFPPRVTTNGTVQSIRY